MAWLRCSRCEEPHFVVRRGSRVLCARCLSVEEPLPQAKPLTATMGESHASRCFFCERWIEKGMTHAAADDHCIRRGAFTPLERS